MEEFVGTSSFGRSPIRGLGAGEVLPLDVQVVGRLVSLVCCVVRATTASVARGAA
jgi:hypothetical protein